MAHSTPPSHHCQEGSPQYLHHGGELRWAQDREDPGQLRVVLPDTLPNNRALAFGVEFAGLRY